jgi:hypothetical protein
MSEGRDKWRPRAAFAGRAEHTGLPLDRVKTYFSLFGASDDMLRFLDEKEVPLKVAAELVRFEKATNEARARRLLEKHLESPLTVQEIAALRKREQRTRGEKPQDKQERKERRLKPARGLVERFEAELRRPGRPE